MKCDQDIGTEMLRMPLAIVNRHSSMKYCVTCNAHVGDGTCQNADLEVRIVAIFGESFRCDACHCRLCIRWVVLYWTILHAYLQFSMARWLDGNDSCPPGKDIQHLPHPAPSQCTLSAQYIRTMPSAVDAYVQELEHHVRIVDSAIRKVFAPL